MQLERRWVDGNLNGIVRKIPYHNMLDVIVVVFVVVYVAVPGVMPCG